MYYEYLRHNKHNKVKHQVDHQINQEKCQETLSQTSNFSFNEL